MALAHLTLVHLQRVSNQALQSSHTTHARTRSQLFQALECPHLCPAGDASALERSRNSAPQPALTRKALPHAAGEGSLGQQHKITVPGGAQSRVKKLAACITRH